MGDPNSRTKLFVSHVNSSPSFVRRCWLPQGSSVRRVILLPTHKRDLRSGVWRSVYESLSCQTTSISSSYAFCQKHAIFRCVNAFPWLQYHARKWRTTHDIVFSSRTCSLRKEPTFCDATTGFPAKWWCQRSERRNSILMTCHYPDLGSPPDWLNQISLATRPIRSTTQIWVVMRHEYGINPLVPQTLVWNGRERGFWARENRDAPLAFLSRLKLPLPSLS